MNQPEANVKRTSRGRRTAASLFFCLLGSAFLADALLGRGDAIWSTALLLGGGVICLLFGLLTLVDIVKSSSDN